MKWYILTSAANKDIRPKNRTGQAEPIYSANIPITVTNWSKYLYSDSLPENLLIPPFKKIRGATITDWMTSVKTQSGYTLISCNLYTCLSQFKLSSYKGYDTVIIDGEKEIPYKVFLQALQFDLIDYSRSIFCAYEKNDISGKYEYGEVANINSHQDIVANKARFGKSIFLKENIPYDGFLILPHGAVFLVNEKIKQALENGGFTGICLIPFNQGEDFINEDIHRKRLRAETRKP